MNKLLYKKNILVVVAHQDDEVLFAGGLLLSLRNKVNLYMVSMSKPRRGRKDTYTREESFGNVARALSAKEFYLTPFYDLGEYRKTFPQMDKQKKEMILFVKGLVENNDINVIITHNSNGEYGHFYHTVVNQVCNEVVLSTNNLSLITFGINNTHGGSPHTVSYDVEEKKELFEFYKPNWDPSSYKFAYLPEVFFVEKVCKT